MLRHLLIGTLLFACSGPQGNNGDDDGSGSDHPDGAVSDDCTVGESVCTAWNTRTHCAATPAGNRMVEETCGGGAGCVAGECVAARCSDECTLGTSEGGKTCELYDVAASTWTTVDAAGSTADRARAYTARLLRDAYRYTGIGHPRYNDPGTWNDVLRLEGLGDSALHTGEYLAGEALRLIATGSVDARANVKKGIEGLHVLMNVTGHPGVLARHATPSNASDIDLFQYDCAGSYSHHCNVSYDGQMWNYRGHVSRDMYQGVMLAFGLAYDALGSADEATRELIRQDVVGFVEELMKERTQKMRFIYNGTPIVTNVTMRFTVLIPDEFVDGAIQLTYGGDEGSWRGFQEFIPNLADVTKQIIGPLSPGRIARDGSAIMLTSFFRMALHITEGVPVYAARRQAIEDFFRNNTGRGGNVTDWVDIMKDFSPGGDGSNGCGGHYYANNLSMQPLYNWARMETDPMLQDTALDLLELKAWPAFKSTKNIFFMFMIQGLARTQDQAAITGAATQLAGFGPPPRVRVPVDLRQNPKYTSLQSGCTDQLVHSQAVDVADRVADEFIWQNNPWELVFGGDPTQVNAGGDYLVAYWLGRRHELMADDRPSVCARWQ